MAAHTSVASSRQASNGKSPLNSGDWTDIAIAVVIAICFAGALIWFARHYSEGANFSILILSGLLGAALGWITGILVSPYNKDEKSSFGGVAKLVYGFLSGYALSKLDLVLTENLKTVSVTEKQWVVVCFGFICFLVALAVTYITRRYWMPTPAKQTPSAAAPNG
jgi:hypothetical protein